jgi:hypothetical protein
MAESESTAEDRPGEVWHTTLRGVIGAMAMTGLRQVTEDLGLIRETPPESIMRRQSRGLFRKVPRKRRKTAIAMLHWATGAAGGFGFGILPDDVRRTPWAGPVWGLFILASYQRGVAPLLGLPQSKDPKVTERLALVADHLLYGFVLSEFRERPRD